MVDSPQIFVRHRFQRPAIDFAIKENRGQDNVFACGLTFAQYPKNENPPVAMSLSDTEAQKLVDRLWDCGFRPSEGPSSADVLVAVGRHLEDMLRLVFNLPSEKDKS